MERVGDLRERDERSATLGSRLRAARKARGFSLSALGAGTVSPSLISRIENGKITPSLATLHFLADRLGLSVGFLLTGADPQPEATLLALELDLELGEAALAAAPEQGRAHFGAALARAEELGRAEQRARAHSGLGRALAAGEAVAALTEAVQHLEAAARHYGAKGGRRLAEAHLALGEVAARRENLALAEGHHRRCLELVEGLPDERDLAARALAGLAAVLRRRGRDGEALAAYRRALDLLAPRADLREQALADLALARECAARGEHERARRHAGRGRVLLEALGQARLVAELHRELGLLHLDRRQHDEALAHLHAAIALDRRLGDAEGEIATQVTLARHHQAAGDLASAGEAARKAVALGGPDAAGCADLCVARVILARIAHAEGRDEEAVAAYAAAADAFAALGLGAEARATYGELGVLLSERGDLERANRYLLRAIGPNGN